MADERGKAIDLAVSQIEKQFGKGSIMRLGSKEAIVPISVIPTGSISFDAALGVGIYDHRPHHGLRARDRDVRHPVLEPHAPRDPHERAVSLHEAPCVRLEEPLVVARFDPVREHAKLADHDQALHRARDLERAR